MHGIRVLSSGDMCMTRSGHTSTLPRLVVQGRGFEASLFQSGFGQKSLQTGPFMTEGVILYISALISETRHIMAAFYLEIDRQILFNPGDMTMS